ncbi:hypothetical protein KG088_18230 [Halomonas sp. TRM85114]|uniref:hypothetical protein n=1 Tax=Halomonas jincaotanensis TaxID=2810616 RepID=UPI001BD39184|nr:hypothetical protein [Halomonas jincaotanensis]MBS9405541.1 hypothetical protein [Halomonas jincaotanensis]
MTDTTLHAGPYDVGRPTLTAIFAGTIVALGLMVLFTLLGLAIGVASLKRSDRVLDSARRSTLS